jgi:hypothetical protein
VTERAAFVAALEAIAGSKRVEAVQRLIDERVSAAAAEECVSLNYHWREDDTGDLYSNADASVGECDAGCPVSVLDRVGLVEVQRLKPCGGDHGWYGEGCPE